MSIYPDWLLTQTTSEIAVVFVESIEIDIADIQITLSVDDDVIDLNFTDDFYELKIC